MPSEGAGPLGAQPLPQVLELAASESQPPMSPPLTAQAPLCKENEELGWLKAAEGSWLGSNKSDWPPGTADFTITFDVTSPDNAHFELQYAADNKVEGANPNPNPTLT